MTKKKNDEAVTNWTKLSESLIYFGSMLSEMGALARTCAKDMDNILKDEETAPIKTEKTTVKKDEKIAEKSETTGETRKVFTKDDPPVSKAEREIFKKQWKELRPEGQTKYLDGEINSVGEILASDESADSDDDFGVLDDMTLDEETPVYTADDLRNACKERAERDGNKKGVAGVFKKFGYTAVKDAKESHYAALIEALEG